MILATFATLTGAAAAADSPAAQPPAALKECAAIAADATRLACYDRLSGRSPALPGSGGAPVPAAPAAPGPLPAAASPPATAPVTAATAAAPPPQSFGLYAAEHPPPPPVADSVQSRVVALGPDAGGRMTVTLEGGQLWELNEADPLLAVGDTVSIARGAFGSFVLQTPTHRSHRARRLR